MAQSAPSYTGLEGDPTFDFSGSDADVALVAAAAPAPASRLDAAGQLWSNLVSAWLEAGSRKPVECASSELLRLVMQTALMAEQCFLCCNWSSVSVFSAGLAMLEGLHLLHGSLRLQPASCCVSPLMSSCVRFTLTTSPARRLTKGGLRYGGSTTGRGLFRDAANAAMLALMYADLPGVPAQRTRWARCMARQTVDYILGDNPADWSYLVGFGCAADHGRSVELLACWSKGSVLWHGMHAPQ